MTCYHRQISLRIVLSVKQEHDHVGLARHIFVSWITGNFQPFGELMQLNSFDVLLGLRLSIVRRAADMLVLHFGDIRTHSSGTGTIGAYALHVQCPWRFDGPMETVTGRDDLWKYAGPGQQTIRGDVRLEFTGGYAILLFPASSECEAWRLFAPGSDHHLVFSAGSDIN